MNIVLNNINNVGELIDGLSNLPRDAKINPFGSAESKLAYDYKKNIAYIDDDFSWLDTDNKEE